MSFQGLNYERKKEKMNRRYLGIWCQCKGRIGVAPARRASSTSAQPPRAASPPRRHRPSSAPQQAPRSPSSASARPPALLFLRCSSPPLHFLPSREKTGGDPIHSPVPARACTARNDPLGRFSRAWLRGWFCISRAWLRRPSRATNTMS
jgi:hypothetical protein